MLCLKRRTGKTTSTINPFVPLKQSSGQALSSKGFQNNDVNPVVGLTLQRYTIHPPRYNRLRSPTGRALDEHIRANHTELTLRLRHPLRRLWEHTKHTISANWWVSLQERDWAFSHSQEQLCNLCYLIQKSTNASLTGLSLTDTQETLQLCTFSPQSLLAVCIHPYNIVVILEISHKKVNTCTISSKLARGQCFTLICIIIWHCSCVLGTVFIKIWFMWALHL